SRSENNWVTSTDRRTNSARAERVGVLGASSPARLGLLVPAGGERAAPAWGSGSTVNACAQGAHVSPTLADVARSRRGLARGPPTGQGPRWGPRRRPSVPRRPSHCIGRVPQQRADGNDGRRTPVDVAEAVLTRQEQLLVIETAHDFGDGPQPQERGKDQVD